MRRTVIQVRDIESIERELNSNPAGALAFCADSESIVQLATTFVYHDKNIYVFFEEDSELFEKIPFESIVKFTVIKPAKPRKTKEIEFDPSYHIFSISVTGPVRKVEEQKQIDDVRQLYIKKYKKEAQEKIDFSLISRPIIIDSEEIQAFEETGG